MKIKAYLCLENGKVNPFHEKTATGLTLCMNSNNTSQPVLRIRLKVVNLFYKATLLRPIHPSPPKILIG